MKFNSIDYVLYKDQFNYYNLIRKINPNYRLFLNKKNKWFYIININNNFEQCYSFKKISDNFLHQLYFSQIHNFNKILNSIEESNSTLEENNKNNLYNKTSFTLNEIKKINNRSNNINTNDINKIIGATQC